MLLNAGPAGKDAPSSVRAAPRCPLSGCETDDPAAAATRAEALLAPVLPRSRGPAEADLAAVAAPDGTAVFFCRTGAADATSWVSDFDPAPAGSAGGRSPTGIESSTTSR